MDLRSKKISRKDLEKLYPAIIERKLIYQPFILSDDLEVGEGLAFMTASSDDNEKKVVYWPDAPESLKNILVPNEDLESFRSANSYLRNIYEHFISFIEKNLKGSVQDKQFLEFGCNTGYFLYRLSQMGAKSAIGIDQTTNQDVFHFFNEQLGTTADFQFGEWDSYCHSLRYSEMPEVDVVLSIAVLCHISDLLHHLTFLCCHAREAVFIWTPVREEDELMLSFGTPSRYSQRAWPLSFDHLIRPTRKLIETCLMECGFEEMIYVPQFSGVNDWYREYWKHHIGVLAFRTRQKKTIFNGGNRRLYVSEDAPSEILQKSPLMPSNPPKLVYPDKSNFNIVYWRGYFFAIPIVLGAVDLDKEDDYALKGIIRSDNLEVLIQKIPKDISDSFPWSVTTSSHHLSDKNINYLLSSYNNHFIWHSQSPPVYPEWIKVAYEKPHCFTTLALQAQETSPEGKEHLRAPKSFKLETSHDGKSWEVLLEVKNAKLKSGNAIKEWKFKNKKAFRFYRLWITGNNGDPDFLTIYKVILS